MSTLLHWLQRKERGYSGGFVRSSLQALVEDETLQQCHDRYLDWDPAPRSTIALAFSPDAQLLASSQ